MLVLIDESGDCGMKKKVGSSEFFVVTAVIFEDNEDAEGCDSRIVTLRNELRLHERFEFKFNRCDNKLRTQFLSATAGFDYFYSSIVINKAGLWGKGFGYKEPFYKYATKLVFVNCKPHLREAKVIIDRYGDREFRNQLAIYLKKQINDKRLPSVIRKVTMEGSHSNNLLQLADMVYGAVARCYSRKEEKNADSFRKLISHRQLGIQVWPAIK